MARSLILLAGQSNMAGHGRVSEAPAELFPVPNFHNFTQPERPDFFGPEAMFAKLTDSTLVKWATAFRTTQAQWHRPLFDQAMDDIRSVIDQPVDALLWMQGEADCRTEQAANEYAEKALSLFNRFRGNLDSPNMRILIGMVNPRTKKHNHTKTVQNEILKIAASDELISIIDTNGLQKTGDGVHYNTTGQLELGKRFADKWNELVV